MGTIVGNTRIITEPCHEVIHIQRIIVSYEEFLPFFNESLDGFSHVGGRPWGGRNSFVVLMVGLDQVAVLTRGRRE